MSAETQGAVTRIAEIRARLTGVTAGPWRVAEEPNPRNDLGEREGFPAALFMPERHLVTDWDHPQLHGPLSIVGISSSPYRERVQALYWDAEANPAFIAHAREDVPWLLDRLAAVERERDEARRALTRITHLSCDIDCEELGEDYCGPCVARAALAARATPAGDDR